MAGIRGPLKDRGTRAVLRTLRAQGLDAVETRTPAMTATPELGDDHASALGLLRTGGSDCGTAIGYAGAAQCHWLAIGAGRMASVARAQRDRPGARRVRPRLSLKGAALLSRESRYGNTWGFEGKVVMVTGGVVPARSGTRWRRVLDKPERGWSPPIETRSAWRRDQEFAALGIDARPGAGDLTERDIASLGSRPRSSTTGGSIGNPRRRRPHQLRPVSKSVRLFDREIAINLKTAFLVRARAVPALTTSGGAIVNFASVAIPPPGPDGHLQRAKAGVAGMTQSWRQSSGPVCGSTPSPPAWCGRTENIASSGEEAHYVEIEQIATHASSWPGPAPAVSRAIFCPLTTARSEGGAQSKVALVNGCRHPSGPGHRAEPRRDGGLPGHPFQPVRSRCR